MAHLPRRDCRAQTPSEEGACFLPVLFTVFGFPVGSYGLSKAVAALVAGLVLARAFQRRGLPSDAAWSLAVPAVLWGCPGARRVRDPRW